MKRELSTFEIAVAKIDMENHSKTFEDFAQEISERLKARVEVDFGRKEYDGKYVTWFSEGNWFTHGDTMDNFDKDPFADGLT